jgi:hypothetical protein
MTVSSMSRLISTSRLRWSLVGGPSGQFRRPGVVGRWTCIAMVTIVFLGPGTVLRQAEAGQGIQAESTPGPDPKRLLAEFHQDFRDKKFDSKKLKVVGSDPRALVKSEKDGLHISIPAGLDKPLPVGVAPRFRTHGDFEITASYSIVKADNPIRGYGLAVALWVETDSDTAEAVTIERGIIPKEGERFTSTRISGPPPPETRKYDVRRARARSRSGKIRMARVGSLVITSFADGTEPFRVLRKVELGPEDLTLARLAAETGMSDHGVEICLEDLTVRAEAFPATPAPH